MDPNPEESKLGKVIGVIKQLNLEPFIFLFMIGVSIKDVTFQTVMMERVCLQKLNQQPEVCSHLDSHKDVKDRVQQITLYYRIAIMLISSIPAAISATFLSPWSDKYGRKLPMMAAVFGVILEGIGTTIIVKASTAPMYIFLLTHIPSGIFGGYLMVISSSYTYLSDVTTRESRAMRFAILEFAYVLASPLGIELGGQVYKYSGAIPVFVTALAANVACFVWIFFVIKETRGLNENKNIKEMLRYLFTLDNLKDTVRTCIAKRPGTLRSQMWLMFFVASVNVFCLIGSMTVGYLFANKMYDWDNPKYSTVTAVSRFMQGAGVVIAIPIFSKMLTIPDSMIAIIGILSQISENVIKTLAFDEWMYYYACFSSIIGGTTSVAVRSRISKMVTQNEVSKVFSLLALCESLTPALAFIVFGALYSASLKVFPGASYLLTALLMLICLIIFIWISKQGPPPTTHETNEGGYRMESFAEEK